MEFEIIYDNYIPRSVLCSSEKRMLLYLVMKPEMVNSSESQD